MSQATPSRSGSRPTAPVGAAPRRRGAKLLLAATSFSVTVLVLELIVRLSGVPSPPTSMREGLYVSQLPLVTGRETTSGLVGPALATAKRPGEIRIFVFGESSVQGLPWGYGGSPVTMLRDQLHTMAPGLDLTVVNMGRSASTMMDAYYYLVSIERYAPDFIVFYQGSNDFFDVDGERCAPATHPALHGAFRWLVEHSRLVWSARALGPRFYRRRVADTSKPAPPVFGKDQQPGDRCDAGQAFAAWTDILVTTARGMGAQVLVTTPVENPLRWPDERASSEPTPEEPYRRLLSCVLDDACDVVKTWKDVRGTPSFTWDRLGPRRDAWARTAAARGARLVDFADDLARSSDDGLRPSLFVEEVHLSLEGYWRLSWLWATEIRSLQEDRSSGSLRAAPPPAFDERFYLAEAPRYGTRATAACSLLRTAALHLRAGYRVLAAESLRSVVRLGALAPGDEGSSRPAATAQHLLAAQRRDAGAEPPAPGPRADDAEVRALVDELRKHDDCSTLPGL
ncbi:MAG: SGNH/GDSL hydrolase family protein [Byssovorax sp.]